MSLVNEQLGNLDHVQRTVIDLAIQFGPKVIVAIAIVVAGFFVGRWIGVILDRGLNKLNLEQPVRQLLVRIARLFVLAFFAILAFQNLGIELLPLIAGLSVAGAGVALAMQGVLSNVMAGLTIIFTKPFHLGEYISIAGEEGVVENISLFSTVLSHADRSQVVIPNRKIVGEILHNYGGIRQLDVAVGVAFDTDLDAAMAVIADLLQTNPRTLKEPSPIIAVSSLGAAAITLSVKPWVKLSDYSQANSEINKAIVDIFRDKGIVIPVAQYQLPIASK